MKILSKKENHYLDYPQIDEIRSFDRVTVIRCGKSIETVEITGLPMLIYEMMVGTFSVSL